MASASAASHAPVVAILSASRRTLTEARPILLESVKINITDLARYKWPTHPLNTDSRVGDILQHVVFDLWPCDVCFSDVERAYIAKLLRSLSKLPVLKSLTIELVPDPAHHHYTITFNSRQENEIQTAVEGAARDFFGPIITGCLSRSKPIRAVVRAHSQHGWKFALKTHAPLRVVNSDNYWSVQKNMVRIRA